MNPYILQQFLRKVAEGGWIISCAPQAVWNYIGCCGKCIGSSNLNCSQITPITNHNGKVCDKTDDNNNCTTRIFNYFIQDSDNNKIQNQKDYYKNL